MTKLWLDTNVFVEAKNGYYALDIAPGFWEALRDGGKSGSVSCPTMVYDEIAKGGDELKLWAAEPNSKILFVEADEPVQAAFSGVAAFVANGDFHPAQVALFLKGADPWVISFAAATQGIVVTQEKLVGPDSKKVKIPNICREFGVEHINSYEMLRRLGIRLKI